MDRVIMEAVARVDIFLSSVPWRRIGLSLLIAAVVVYVVGKAIFERGRG